MAMMRTSAADYQYALEGIGYAQVILKKHMQNIDDILSGLNQPEVLGGETGKEYCQKMKTSVETVETVVKKFDAFANKVEEICRQNGAQVDGAFMEDFDAVSKAFTARAEEIAKFNGTKKA